MYYEDCEYDVCANWDDPTDEVCRSLETFLAFCYELGAGEINFRTDMFCPGKANGTRTRRCEILGRLRFETCTATGSYTYMYIRIVVKMVGINETFSVRVNEKCAKLS